MNEREILPVGTVVTLKGASRNLMITGYFMIKPDEQKKIYDYCGCMFPQGIISNNMNFLFDGDQIEKVLFKGYENDEYKEYSVGLMKAVNQKTNE